MDAPRPASAGDAVVETDVPARLDRLPWSRFHWLVITALGITWILDGLEVTLVGALSGAIHESPSLQLSSTEIGLTASAYLAGAVLGALFFGHLTDRLGRKKLFTATVLLYAVATAASGFSWDFWSFAIFRFLAGAGIGGEYSAINSAIQELIPARRRGYTDLVVNGSYWLGAALGAGGSLVALNLGGIPPEQGWRGAFIIGGVIGLVVIFLRRFLPESPRWLMTHGRVEEADLVVRGIEARVERERGKLPPVTGRPLRLRRDHRLDMMQLVRSLFVHYPRRTTLGVTLMAAQAFCYNAIFFTYALILTKFYGIASGDVGWFMLPFAISNFLGPLLLGSLFDTVGRKTMIAATYALSGILMAVSGLLFQQGALDAVGLTLAWTAIFFFASAAASAAYLTVSESFPLEMRAIAIAIFYAFGTALGGIGGPALFGALIETGSRIEVMWGYVFGGVLMLIAAAVEAAIGLKSERRPLEEVARPLSCCD
ncbi:MFS transporter [Vineibacter terrae]|uniref:MFS transporter n=1 Tax=Vineibacter terrae TaxID=2586908 RepID=UPI002E327551|nr:MFS transporter [Vineibacter terrae]HEX2891775.1 MFS transporter [Vineibacter terrae]